MFFAAWAATSFWLFFSDTNIFESEQILQRIVEKIDDFNLNRENQFEMSISYGLAEYSEPWMKNNQELLEEADKKMYEAKKKYKKLSRQAPGTEDG